MGLYKFVVDETKCMNCGACMDLCPSTCIEFTRPTDTGYWGSVYGSVPPRDWMMEKPYLIDQERCTGCQICVRECPTNAVTVELDTTKPASARPKPVIIRRPRMVDDGRWHPLSEYTTEYLKRPVTSMWSAISDWKPVTESPLPSEVWRSMRKPKVQEKASKRPEAAEAKVEES